MESLWEMGTVWVEALIVMLVLGLIALMEKYLLVVMKELNYKLEVKFMTEVPVNISNMKLI